MEQENEGGAIDLGLPNFDAPKAKPPPPSGSRSGSASRSPARASASRSPARTSPVRTSGYGQGNNHIYLQCGVYITI